MGSEGFIFIFGALIGWGLIGLAVAFAIKRIRKHERLPGWPILLFAVGGAIASVVLGIAARSS